MSRKLNVLHELMDAMIYQREWFDKPLPLGYTTTGRLHTWECGGSGARSRIDELRKADIDVHYRCFTHINKKTKLLADPAQDGIIDDEMIEKYYERLIDGFGRAIECHAYCLKTPLDRIDAETGKIKKGLFEQSTMEF